MTRDQVILLVGFFGALGLGAAAFFTTSRPGRGTPTKGDQPVLAQAPRATGATALIGDSIGVGIAPFLAGVTSFARVGASTRTMLGVARSELRPGRFGTVIFEGHLNDAGESADWTIANLRQAYQAARDAGAQVVAVTSTPWSGYSRWTAARGAERDRVDRWIASGADGLVDRVVDLRNVTAEQAPDGLHFTRAGYRVLAATVLR